MLYLKDNEDRHGNVISLKPGPSNREPHALPPISTGKFYAGDAVLMIEHMEKIGEIEPTEYYHMYRRRIAASPEENHCGDGIG